MQQSNSYIIIFSLVLTIVIGGLLSVTSEVLKPAQKKQIELDTKKKILGAVMDISSIKKPEEILALYDERMSSKVIDINGGVVTKDKKGNPLLAENIDIKKNHKIPADERFFPVFMLTSEKNKSQVEAYVLPMFGSGLWDWISGYLALESDLNTIKGVAFDHKTETPGLGARISSDEIQNRYKSKKIFDKQGELVAVSMVKGEKGLPHDDHHVDGMSGATMTGNGVNDMLLGYLKFYSAFIEKEKSAEGPGLASVQ